MKRFVGQTCEGDFRVIVERSTLEAINRLCTIAGNKETGGILIGRYTDDNATAVILEATPPPADSKDGSTWFVRGFAGLRQLLLQRWRSKDRSYYVGEWHYHPANVIVPSDDDWTQMDSIARAPEYRCSEPILLIAGKSRRNSTSRPLRAFVCPIDQFPKELIAANTMI